MANIVVVKVGGSLLLYPEALRLLMKRLSTIAGKKRLTVVPGGGSFADTVRVEYRRLKLSESAAHWMAVLAVDQYGILLQDLARKSSVTVRSIRDALSKASQGILPILLPSQIIFQKDPLERSWKVTSDSIAGFIASMMKAEVLILVKDVNGLYTEDPKIDSNASPIPRIPAGDLIKDERQSCVDRFLPNILVEKKLRCFIVNGLHPERVEALVKGERTICTEVVLER